MKKKLIIVTGYLAAGKTTFSTKLSQSLQLPCLQKDTVKSVIGREIEMKSRTESSLFSRVTFDLMMHFADRLMACGYPFILEGNFNQGNGVVLQELIDHYGYETLTYFFQGDLGILHQRFLERDLSEERDPVNKIHGLLDRFEDFENVAIALDAFSVSGTIMRIDGTYFSPSKDESAIESARNYLNTSAV
jgi:predicted kinase